MAFAAVAAATAASSASPPHPAPAPHGGGAARRPPGNRVHTLDATAPGPLPGNYKSQKAPPPAGVSQWGSGGEAARSAPAGERGDVIAQRAAAGARRRSLCLAGAASRCRCRPRRGGPALLQPPSAGPGRSCLLH